MRNKLIELLYNGFYVSPKDDLNGVVQKVADYLIAHGVTLATDNNVFTKADRIRTMSDEELAKMFSGTILCVPEGRCHGNPKTSCYECWLNWLKQPAKEDT